MYGEALPSNLMLSSRVVPRKMVLLFFCASTAAKRAASVARERTAL